MLELRALYLIVKHSAPKLHLQPLLILRLKLSQNWLVEAPEYLLALTY